MPGGTQVIDRAVVLDLDALATLEELLTFDEARGLLMQGARHGMIGWGAGVRGGDNALRRAGT